MNSVAPWRRIGWIAFSAASLVGAAACTAQFLRWRSLEALLGSSFCGNAAYAAMTLGQCSHCWAVAGMALGVAALAPWAHANRIGARA